MNSQSLGDLLITIATNAMLTAGGTHVDYEFRDEYCVYNPTRFAFPNLILENCFFCWLSAVEAYVYARHVIPFPLWAELVESTAGYYRAKRSYCK